MKKLTEIFNLDDETELTFDTSHLRTAQAPDAARSAAANFLDLTDKRKLLMLAGLGQTGKTTFARYVVEQAIKAGRTLVTADADSMNQDLTNFFTDVHRTTGPNARPFVNQMISHLLKAEASGLIDFGGNDQALPEIVTALPTLAQTLETSGLFPVLCFFLTPRVSDLTVLSALQGFNPSAVALVLNMGRAENASDFATVRRHSLYRARIDAGAAEIWMPRLFEVGPMLERKRWTFARAMDETTGLDVLARLHLASWLTMMGDALAPVTSWLP